MRKANFQRVTRHFFKMGYNGKCSISLRILKHLPVNLHEMKIVAQIFNNLLTRNGCYTLLWAGV